MSTVRLVFEPCARGVVGEIRPDGADGDVTLAVSADAGLSDVDIANLRVVADALSEITSDDQ